MMRGRRFAIQCGGSVGMLVLILSGQSALHANDETEERFRKLEAAVQQLEARNAELEEELRLMRQRVERPVSTAEMLFEPVFDSKGARGALPTPARTPRVFAEAAGSEFELTLGGFIQAQVEAGDVGAFEGKFGRGISEIKDRFRVRRSRIYVAGEYDEHFQFKLEGEFQQTDVAPSNRFENLRRTSFGATDLFINWSAFPELEVKAGQFKAPFGYEQLISDSKHIFVERSLVTTALTPDRQVGIQFHGKPFANVWPEQKDRLTYYAGIFNGTGRNIFGNDNNEFLYVGRLEVLLLQAELARQPIRLQAGLNGLWSRDDAGTTISPLLEEDIGGSLSSLTLPSAGERSGFGVDAALLLGPFQFSAEYLEQRVDTRRQGGAAPNFSPFRASGYSLQAGYYVVPDKLQLVARWDSFTPGQLVDDDIRSVYAGVNYYIRGDDLKLMAAYVHTWSEYRRQNPGLGADEFNEFIARLQVMF